VTAAGAAAQGSSEPAITRLSLIPATASSRSVPKPLGVSQAPARLLAAGEELIGLGVPEARHHVHLLGPTGTGKSTLLLRLVLADALAGRGVALIDPHGDLALRVLERLPARCAERLVLIDPEQTEAPVAWNVLDPAVIGAELVTEHLVATLHRLYAAWWGPRLEDTLRAACLTLTHPANQAPEPRAELQPGSQPRQAREWATERGSERAKEWAGERAGGPTPSAATLADIPLLLTSPAYRARMTSAVRRADPGGLGAFWDAYDALSPAQLAGVGGPVLSKLRAITSRRFALDLLGAAPSTLDMGDVLDGGILIARLPKGILGEDTTRLVGSLLLTGLWQAATARTRQPETQRLDAAVYIDECHNFLHLPIGLDDALAESRSYRLSWNLAHQHLGQLSKTMADAIDANARNKIYFALTPQDAHLQARHTNPHLTEDDLSRLSAYQIACRLMAGGQPALPFTLQTLPPPPPIPGSLRRARQAAAAHGLPADVRREHAARRRRLTVPGAGTLRDLPTRRHDPSTTTDADWGDDSLGTGWSAHPPAHSLAQSPAHMHRANEWATRPTPDPRVTDPSGHPRKSPTERSSS
jgi:hypothetical protein